MEEDTDRIEEMITKLGRYVQAHIKEIHEENQFILDKLDELSENIEELETTPASDDAEETQDIPSDDLFMPDKKEDSISDYEGARTANTEKKEIEVPEPPKKKKGKQKKPNPSEDELF